MAGSGLTWCDEDDGHDDEGADDEDDEEGDEDPAPVPLCRAVTHQLLEIEGGNNDERGNGDVELSFFLLIVPN